MFACVREARWECYGSSVGTLIKPDGVVATWASCCLSNWLAVKAKSQRERNRIGIDTQAISCRSWMAKSARSLDRD